MAAAVIEALNKPKQVALGLMPALMEIRKMRRKLLIFVAIAVIAVSAFASHSEANYWACDCYFCYMYPDSDCITPGFPGYGTSCAFYYLDPVNQCVT